MLASQPLLFPDPQPLVERLGTSFFREVPESAGVYLMRDAKDAVLYVGKARNLRKRLSAYRVANPDRMPRRHLRMLREVERIEVRSCRGEKSALAQEARLLRTLKPKFNRMGVWQGSPRFFVWKISEARLEMSVVQTPAPEWQRFGPLGGNVAQLHNTLAKLLWSALNPSRGLAGRPVGWAQGRFMNKVTLRCGSLDQEVSRGLESFFWGTPDDFLAWLRSRLVETLCAFEKSVIESELQVLRDFGTRRWSRHYEPRQLVLL